MNKLTRQTISAAVIGVFFTGIAALPAVADSNDAPTMLVKFADLDLSHVEGATRLYGRIRLAAEDVCAPSEGPGLAGHVQKQSCIDRAISDAVAKVGNPVLTALYRQKTGKDVSTRLAAR